MFTPNVYRLDYQKWTLAFDVRAGSLYRSRPLVFHFFAHSRVVIVLLAATKYRTHLKKT